MSDINSRFGDATVKRKSTLEKEKDKQNRHIEKVLGIYETSIQAEEERKLNALKKTQEQTIGFL